MINRYILPIALLLAILWLTACNKDHQGTEALELGQSEQAVRQVANDRFTFTPNTPFNALYTCGRLNSNLVWYFLFHDDNTLQVLFTTDTHEDYVFDGSYSYQNDQLHLMMPAGPSMPFPQGLDERSTVIMPQFGLIGAFATSEMVCICQGHDLNPQDPPKTNANYDCPNINFQAATDEDNAIEFMLTNVPFEFPVPGSIFRHQETWVQGLTNPLIRRATGIYRQDGDQFFATFRLLQDFAELAGDQLPVELPTEPPFEDYNLISGEFRNDGQEVIVHQLDPGAGPCSLR